MYSSSLSSVLYILSNFLLAFLYAEVTVLLATFSKKSVIPLCTFAVGPVKFIAHLKTISFKVVKLFILCDFSVNASTFLIVYSQNSPHLSDVDFSSFFSKKVFNFSKYFCVFLGSPFVRTRTPPPTASAEVPTDSAIFRFLCDLFCGAISSASSSFADNVTVSSFISEAFGAI